MRTVSELKRFGRAVEEPDCGVFARLDGAKLLWKALRGGIRQIPYKDLVEAIDFLDERDATRRVPRYELDFDLRTLSELHLAKEATGSSHSRVLEAYLLLFFIAERNPER